MIVAANWKMNPPPSEAASLFDDYCITKKFFLGGVRAGLHLPYWDRQYTFSNEPYTLSHKQFPGIQRSVTFAVPA